MNYSYFDGKAARERNFENVPMRSDVIGLLGLWSTSSDETAFNFFL